MTDVASRTADALLTAMDAEEPFRLLRTLPGRLQELCEAERQRMDSETRLAGEVALIQSQNYDLICSGTSRIQDRAKEVKSISDAHVQRFQREADILQDALEKLRNSHRPNALQRRHRVRGISLKEADNEISKLQSASVRIQDITYYVCNVVKELARDEIPLYALAEQALDEVGLSLGASDDRVRPSRHHPTHSDGFDHEEVAGVRNSLQMLIADMEERCKDVEASITSNNEMIEKQTVEIERLRRMPNNSCDPDGPTGDAEGEGYERYPVPCFVLTVALMLATFVALLKTI